MATTTALIKEETTDGNVTLINYVAPRLDTHLEDVDATDVAPGTTLRFDGTTWHAVQNEAISVSATDTTTTTSSDFVGVSAMQLTTSSAVATDYDVTFTAAVKNTQHRKNTFVLFVDGVPVTASEHVYDSPRAGEEGVVTIRYVLTGVTDGSVISVGWKRNGGTLRAGVRSLTARPL
jgi:hypothetical protein